MPKKSLKSKGLLASIIVITKNQKHLLQKTLPVLLKQNTKKSYEIIVVDSGSSDGAVEYLKSLPVKLVRIKPKTFNFANAFNTGAQKAKGKYLVRLSGDVIPIGKNWLSEILKPFKDPKVGGTYGRYTITGKKGYGYPDFWPAERFPEKITRYSVKPTPFVGFDLFGFEIGNQKIKEEVYNFAGACCAVRKKIWEKRSFNEKLIAAEDAEYSLFLHLIGYDIVYNPRAGVIHEHKISKTRQRSFWAKRAVSKWQLIFTWEISKYWLWRLIGRDPYKKLKRK